MRVLALDVENRFTRIGLFDGARLERVSTVTTVGRTADEFHLLMESLLGVAVVDRVILACVVPGLTGALRSALERWAPGVLVVGPGIKTGLALAVDNPREVGADRVVGAVGAVERYGAPVMVVDFRTATTVDVVDAAGVFRGGAIAAGIEVSAEALADSAAALRHVDIVLPPRVVGKNTVEAIQAGIVLGAAAMVDGLIGRIEEELGLAGAPVVATGIHARTIAGASRRIDHVDEELTLLGLRLVAERSSI